MKRYLFFALIFGLLTGCSKKDNNPVTPPEESGGVIPPIKGWELVWNDEFSKEGMPDSTKWKYEYGPNWANGELQYYTKGRPENVRVKEGLLVLEAKQESYGGRNYTSTRLNSVSGWTYGRMEVRAKLPKGNGLWPAIWMMPVNSTYGGWPNSGEIDIMENWSWNQTGIYGTVHTEAYNHIKRTQKGGNITVSRPWDEFHKYVIEWTDKNIKFMVDDSLYFTFNNEGNIPAWPFNHQFRFILNIAVEKTAPGEEWTWQKKTMEVDYVRVYRKIVQL